MPLELTIALLGDSLMPLLEQLPDVELDRPYPSRPTVSLTVDEQTTLGAATQEAVDLFREAIPAGDFTDAGVLFAFYSERDSSRPWTPLSPVITLVDRDGRALWNQRADEATFRELMHAAEHDTLLGDPTRPYVVLNPPIGNGWFGSWQDVANAWLVFWHFVKTALIDASVLGGALSLVTAARSLRERPSTGVAAVIDRHHEAWSERGATPHDLGTFLNEKPRSTEAVARLLDVPPSDAATLLDSRGLVQELGFWIPGTDEASGVLRRVAPFLDWTESRELADFEERLRRVIEGEDPWA